MTMIEIRAEIIIRAEPSRVWDVLQDYENSNRWLSFSSVVRRRPGVVEPNGVGAVRTLRGRFRVMEERIITFEPCRKLEYQVIKGAPGWATQGHITLTPMRDGGTLVWWRVTLDPYVPVTGWLIKSFLGRSLAQSLQRLKERLEPDWSAARGEAKLPIAEQAAAAPVPGSTRRRAREASRPQAEPEANRGATTQSRSTATHAGGGSS